MSTAASPQADAEMIAQLGHGDLWAAYSPLFQRACQCLCCFTLWFPQRSWINIISPPQGITALVSPSLFIAAATGVLLCIKALWRWPYIRDFSCALNGSNWFRSMPWHNNRSSCNFSGLSTLNPLKCFFFSFLFRCWGSMFSLRRCCESSVCEGWGWMPHTGKRLLGRAQPRGRIRPSVVGRTSWLPLEGDRQCSEVPLSTYPCEKDRQVGGARCLCQVPPTSLV